MKRVCRREEQASKKCLNKSRDDVFKMGITLNLVYLSSTAYLVDTMALFDLEVDGTSYLDGSGYYWYSNLFGCERTMRSLLWLNNMTGF